MSTRDERGSPNGARRAAWLFVLVPIAVVFFWLTGDPSDPDRERSPTSNAERTEVALDGGFAIDAEPTALEHASESIADAGSPSGSAPVRLSAPTLRRGASYGAGVLAGRVLAWASGRPVPAAELTFGHEDGASSSVRADAEGRFEFAPDASGSYVLAVAVADGFLPFAPEWGQSPVHFEARPGFRVEGVVVYLVDAVDYLVEVTDPAGEPVQGATVRIHGAASGERSLAPIREHYVTDARGEVAIHAPDEALVEAEHPEAGLGRARVNGAAQVSHRIPIRLSGRVPDGFRGDRSIAGRVVDAEGRGIENATIVARGGAHRPHPDRSATSDARGRFRIDGLDPVPYRVLTTADGYAMDTRDRVAAGTMDLAIRLAPGGAVRVRVIDDATDEPVAAATVIVERQVGALQWQGLGSASGYDAEGRFEVDGLPVGACRVLAASPGYATSAPADARAAIEPREIEVRLSRGGTVVGRVVSSDDARPLEGARVTLEDRLGSSSSAVPLAMSALTDADGRFELSGAPFGMRSIVAWAADHHGRVRSGIVVAEEAVDVGVLDLSPVAEGERPLLELAGIGAVLSADGDVMRIGRVIEGGGAAAAGLAAGDAILEVEGAPVDGLGFGGTIERIRGPEGTTVRLRVQRAGSQESELLPVQRMRIRV